MPNRRMPDGEDEGFGLVFLEANAMGVPVLGGRAGGVPEVVLDGETGLLVDGTDPDAVAAGLLRLLTEPALRQRLVAGGLAAAAEAGWGHRAAAFLAVCERVTGQSGPARATQMHGTVV
jgi:phosphatidylinositol alpha-1,6-mannosyltransferase